MHLSEFMWFMYVWLIEARRKASRWNPNCQDHEEEEEFQASLGYLAKHCHINTHTHT